MKRFRKSIIPVKIRFYHCGEYGENLGRPHYHALIFGYDFPDKEFWKETRGSVLYTSEKLEALWGKGFCSIGNVTFKSAAYVARYIMKKQTGKTAPEHYRYTDPETGEISQRLPEYTTMSRGGKGGHGIGYDWFIKYNRDVYPSDFCVIEGKKYKTPRYYDRMLEEITPKGYLSVIKAARMRNAEQRSVDNTPDRLAVREKVQELKLRQLERSLDNEDDDVLNV